MSIRIVSTLLCLLLATTAAQAEITTSNVKVLVTGKRCSELTDVYLVINGNDREDRWVRLEPAGTCRWTADLGNGTISTKNAKFSLRGDFARTDCQKATANETELTANLEFACCVQGPLRNVGVRIEPPMPFTYMRNVRPSTGTRVPGVPCIEKATFDEGQGTIGHTQFSGEDVYLHLWPVDRKQRTFGLLLDNIVVDNRPRVLTRDDVAHQLMVQRAQGKGGSVPTLSSNAMALDLKKLAELKFERAQLEVIK